MSVFRRRRRDGRSQETAETAETAETGEVAEGAEGLAAAEADAEEEPAAEELRSPSGVPVGPGRENGPWDVTEVVNPAAGGRVDLGGMWLPGRPGLEVRIEADQATSQVVAVTLVLGDGALQVQPFAAPRTENIWDEIRGEIRAGITKQGGTADEVEGPLGTELRTRVPVRAQDGTSGVQPARFVGVDGPRWFLRGVLTGRAAVEAGADAELIELFRDIVVVRGDGPMAPRDPIPLSLPPAQSTDEPDPGSSGGPSARSQDDLKPFERGPEITEIR